MGEHGIQFHSIPYDTIDQYFFQEFAVQLEPSLKPLLHQKRFLCGKDTDEVVETLKGLYNGLYLFPPAFLDDIFEIREIDTEKFVKGCAALSLSCIFLDNRIDQQLQDIPAAQLIERHLLTDVYRCWNDLIPSPDLFWDRFHDYLSQYYRALTLESACLDAYQQRYDFDIMRMVTDGKALTAHIAIDLMSRFSGNLETHIVLHSLVNQMLFAGQLLEDISDWEEDFRNHRCTLPLLLALESEGDTPAALKTVPLEDMTERIERHGILHNLLEHAIHILEACKAALNEAGWENSKLGRGLQEGLIDPAYRKKRYILGAALLRGMVNKLDARKEI